LRRANACFELGEFVVFRSSRLRTRSSLQFFFANAISQVFRRPLCRAKLSHRESALLQLLPYLRRDSGAIPVFHGLSRRADVRRNIKWANRI
jgi:hypothetical protein